MKFILITLTLASIGCSKRIDRSAELQAACKQGESVAMEVLRANGISLQFSASVDGRELQKQADAMCAEYAAGVLK